MTERQPGLFQLYQQGVAVEEIARRYNLSAAGVAALLNRAGQSRPASEPVEVKGYAGVSKAARMEQFEAVVTAYKSGETLAQIGEKHGVTRERIRQIIQREVARRMGIRPKDIALHRDQIAKGVDELKVEGKAHRSFESDIKEKVRVAQESGLLPEYFNSAGGYANAVGITLNQLKTHHPEICEAIKRARAARWSTHYDKCRECGTRSVKHAALGYCETCYPKSEYFKGLQKKSYQKHFENRQVQNRKYRAKYEARPEVRERLDREYDEKFFGGNRSAVVERDGHKCTVCNRPDTDTDSLGRRIVVVYHLNHDLSDHRLENLRMLCRRCWSYGYNPNFGHGRGRRQ